MSLLISLLGIVLTILVVIGVHEFGHFIVARLVGIKVLRFSIGFGKALFRWYDKKGTEYVIAAIPLGGYVKMADETEEEVAPHEVHQAFNRQPAYKKLAVVCAGPFANIFFAGLLYWFVFVIGFTTVKPIIGEVTPHSIAAKSGITSLQEIIKVDNDPTISWFSVMIKMLEHVGSNHEMTIETLKGQNQQVHRLDLSQWKMDELKPDPLQSLGITPYAPPIAPIIAEIAENSPAAIAGLKPQDKVIAIGTQKIKDWIDIVNIISEAPEQTLQFKMMRNNKMIVIPVTIGVQRSLFFKKYGFLGIIPKADYPQNMLRYQKFGPLAAIPEAYQQVKLITQMNLIMVGKLILGKVSFKSLGGPITIFESAGKSLNYGMIPFMTFLAFLSISIGIINIFPIPGLDGGHVLFQAIEFVTRRPLSPKLQLLLYRLGLILLILLIIQSLSNDILRL